MVRRADLFTLQKYKHMAEWRAAWSNSFYPPPIECDPILEDRKSSVSSLGHGPSSGDTSASVVFLSNSEGTLNLPVNAILIALVVNLVAISGASSGEKSPNPEKGDGRINFGAERPYDATKFFGDFGTSLQLPESLENSLWWERMLRGEVGREHYLVLCAMNDGNWKLLGDVRDFVEFQTRKSYPVGKLQEMLVRMAGGPDDLRSSRFLKMPKFGEGWLEKNHNASFEGIGTKWRIAPSVLPLLYLLLMRCPDDNRCNR